MERFPNLTLTPPEPRPWSSSKGYVNPSIFKCHKVNLQVDLGPFFLGDGIVPIVAVCMRAEFPVCVSQDVGLLKPAGEASCKVATISRQAAWNNRAFTSDMAA